MERSDDAAPRQAEASEPLCREAMAQRSKTGRARITAESTFGTRLSNALPTQEKLFCVPRITPELSRADERPRRWDNLSASAEAAKRTRLERIVRAKFDDEGKPLLDRTNLPKCVLPSMSGGRKVREVRVSRQFVMR